MMMIAFEEKDVVDFVTGKKIAADAKDKADFDGIQAKIKLMIMASLSMELGQQVMMNKTGTEMWKYLEDFYEGKTNAATRANQEIILFNRLQTARCKAGEDVAQHVDKMFTFKAQLAALNADVRGPILIQMLVQSLPKNERFDRLKGMMESGSKKMDSPEKVKDQILRMASYNRKDRVLAAHDQGTNVGVNQQGESRAADWKQGTCFKCHLPGHRFNECPSKDEKDENDEKDLEVLEGQQ
ncbi:hypothetical protein PF005_g19968 [Phytophthora fragariae]|uniref:CCHC-type domain-containing protein n=1 Tax=Phytophthora fragariae TaxID=53985 RepID=A0A6A3Y081_9STRA|nr:hypothetical protein PF003_g32914 [Phytophthora fragariae]KAE8930223.1 hypothetical protein PF009_g19677 [Phytophthora fragariae]KAE8989461.1 hypothetical protein PF011_g18760 [Phytophthora fragariae]KAE9090720.1 hypothetical protein PF010_g18483 [Phytophthora fragariae]KAE9091428.1 hypothetical protein PF007_g18882 [Phytophthora fragariae]